MLPGHSESSGFKLRELTELAGLGTVNGAPEWGEEDSLGTGLNKGQC